MTLVQLRYIVALDTERHFGRAAARCGVSQPTLSTQVRRLESELGVEVFDRSRQPVEPTDLGRRVVEQARVVLREADRLRSLIEEAGGTVVGELRLGVLPTLAPYLLPRMVAELTRRYPDLSLHVEEHQTEELLERLERGSLDAGLIASDEGRSGLSDRPLFVEPFVGYVGDDHPLHAQDRIRESELGLDRLWLLQEGHCFRDQVLRVCGDVQRVVRGRSSAGEEGGAGLEFGGGIARTGAGLNSDTTLARPLHFESGNLETLKRLVDRNGGMTLLPYLAVADLTPEERARVRPFHRPAPARTVRLVHGKTYLKRAMLEAVEKVVGAVVPPELRTVSLPSAGAD